MKRPLLLGSLTAALLVPAPLALAASATAQPTPKVARASTNMHTDIAGGAVGSVSGVVAITTFSQYCTGALIAPRIVLTAAHCVDDVTNPSTIGVRPNQTSQSLGVSRFYRAPGYNPATHDNDAAVLILNSPAKVRALGLVSAEPAAGTAARITGYGQHTYTSGIAHVAYSADTTVQSLSACQAVWAEYDSAVPSSDICAGDAADNTATITRGDSGGPLLVQSPQGNWRVAGINDLVVIPNDVYNGAIPQAFARVDTIRPWLEAKIARFSSEQVERGSHQQRGR
jgi:secreted trypsin-like serine protease